MTAKKKPKVTPMRIEVLFNSDIDVFEVRRMLLDALEKRAAQSINGQKCASFTYLRLRAQISEGSVSEVGDGWEAVK